MRSAQSLRVALVSSDYVTDGHAGGGGGIETYVHLMSRGLVDAGHDVHVVAPTSRRTLSFLDGGAHVHAIEVPDEWGQQLEELPESRGALSFAWHARRKVRALMAAHGPFDAVEVPEYKAQGYYLAKDPDIPLVVKCHAHLLLCAELNGVRLTRDTALLADLERETLQTAPAIASNSRALADRCASDYALDGERIAHVPYGIDTEWFRPRAALTRDQLGVGRGPLLLFVGRLEARKGIETLATAFASVRQQVPDAVLVLAGGDIQGPPAFSSNAAWLRARWAELGVPNDAFRFLGPVPHADLPALYASADVMVAPSPFEAFGLIYLEAMACGCPPIACAAGGALEVVRNGETGVLVEPSSPDALAHAIVSLLRSPEQRQRLAGNGRAAVLRDYTVTRMVERTIQLYREGHA